LNQTNRRAERKVNLEMSEEEDFYSCSEQELVGLADREQEVEIESDEQQDLIGLTYREQEVEIESDEEQDLMGLADKEQEVEIDREDEQDLVALVEEGRKENMRRRVDMEKRNRGINPTNIIAEKRGRRKANSLKSLIKKEDVHIPEKYGDWKGSKFEKEWLAALNNKLTSMQRHGVFEIDEYKVRV
jgi:uncharacterized membrane protein